MAIYNLAYGGFTPSTRGDFHSDCKCSKGGLSEAGIPQILQPENRDNYRFRDKRTLSSLETKMQNRYNLSLTDLQVGDVVIVFLQPNFSTLKSVQVDNRVNVNGFTFDLVLVNDKTNTNIDILDKAEKIQKANYSICDGVEPFENVAWAGALNEDNQAVVVSGIDETTAEVVGVALKITSMPNDDVSLLNGEMLFSRHYEMCGYFM